MDTPKWYWKYDYDIPLDTDERFAIEEGRLKEKESNEDNIQE